MLLVLFSMFYVFLFFVLFHIVYICVFLCILACFRQYKLPSGPSVVAITDVIQSSKQMRFSYMITDVI